MLILVYCSISHICKVNILKSRWSFELSRFKFLLLLTKPTSIIQTVHKYELKNSNIIPFLYILLNIKDRETMNVVLEFSVLLLKAAKHVSGFNKRWMNHQKWCRPLVGDSMLWWQLWVNKLIEIKIQLSSFNIFFILH